MTCLVHIILHMWFGVLEQGDYPQGRFLGAEISV